MIDQVSQVLSGPPSRAPVRIVSNWFLALPLIAGATLLLFYAWTGFRAATPDKLPLIGPWQDDNTIYLATGHEGLGITTSLGTAQLLAEQFAGRVPEISFEPYLPKRPSLQVLHA